MKTLTLALMISAAMFGSTDVATTSYPTLSTSCQLTLAKNGQTKFVCTDTYVKADGAIVEKDTTCKNPIPTMWDNGTTSVTCADKWVNATRANVNAAVSRGVQAELDHRELLRLRRQVAELSNLMFESELHQAERELAAIKDEINRPSSTEQYSGPTTMFLAVLWIGFLFTMSFVITKPSPFRKETFQSECKLSDGTELGTVGNRNKKHGWKYAIRDKDGVVEAVEVGHEVEDLTDFSEAHKYPAYVAGFDDNDSPWYIETRDRAVELAVA